MDCSKADIYFMKYMDNCLSDTEAKELNTHLKECEKCRIDFLVYDSLVKEFSNSKLYEAPEDLEFRVMAEIRKLEPISKKANKKVEGIMLGLSGIFVFLLFSALILLVNRDNLLSIMGNNPQLDVYMEILTPISLFVSNLSMNVQTIVTNAVTSGTQFVNEYKYIVLAISLILFGLQYVMYKKDSKKIEE